jgi:hypothetical protein
MKFCFAKTGIKEEATYEISFVWEQAEKMKREMSVCFDLPQLVRTTLIN